MRKSRVLLSVLIAVTCFLNNCVKSEGINGNESDESTEDDPAFLKFMHQLISTDGYFFEMYLNMDLAMNPCDDFYQYACGDFNEMHPMEPGKIGHGIIQTMTDSINQDLYKILSGNTSEEVEDLTVSNGNNTNIENVILKTKIFYDSCLNADIFNFRKSEEYVAVIESLGGMPFLNSNWTSKDFDLTKVIATLKLYGATVFIDEYTSEKYVYVKKGVDFGLLPISLDDLNKISSRMYNINKNLIKYIMDLYSDEELDTLDAVDEILDFGRKFLTNVQSIPPSKTKYKRISYLAKNYPQIDWVKYFSILFGKPVDQQFKVIISDLHYFEAFVDLFTGEDMKSIANYLMVKLLFELHSELKSSRFSRMFCLIQSQNWLEPIPNLMYITSRYYDNSLENKAYDMAEDIRNAFSETIKEANWLDEPTKHLATDKLYEMKIYAGSKNLSIDLDTFNNFYKNLEIVEANYYRNNLNVRQFKIQNNHNILTENLKKFVKAKVDIEVNAQYRLTSNELHLPAGILQKPMFFPGMPSAYNFASMGANIIGHEMVHGFDSMGRNYDSNGNKLNWWSPKSDEEFEKRAQCFVDQYNSYVIEGLNIHVNGSNTLAENIADNGGLRLGFKAYKKMLEGNKGEVIFFGGFNYTNIQFYFLSFAQASCSEFKRKGLLRIAEDVHTADKFRVIGPLSNFDEFSKAFNCPVNSPMNPIHKCVLW